MTEEEFGNVDFKKDAKSSIKLNRTSTGKIGWEIKVYCEPGEEKELPEQINQLDIEMKDLFNNTKEVKNEN